LYKISKRYNKLLKKNIFKLKLLLIKKRGLKYIRKNKKQKNIIFKALKYNTIEQKMFYEKIIKKYEIRYYKQFIKKSLRRILLFIYFKQLIYINKTKFNNSYLQNLTNLIKKIYKKNIQFNFINVKYFYLNSDIFTQSLVLKLRKNRRKLLRYLKSSILKTNIKNKINPISKYIFNLNNLNKFNLYNNDLDTTNELLYNLLLQNKIKSKYLKKIVLDNIRYKKISGIRIQATGRLTKRYTASRSISKLRYKGNLINISSSLKGRSSALLRGKFRPNLQFTKLNSKTRIGSFGIKG
jgi:ribosomal protein S3